MSVSDRVADAVLFGDNGSFLVGFVLGAVLFGLISSWVGEMNGERAGACKERGGQLVDGACVKVTPLEETKR